MSPPVFAPTELRLVGAIIVRRLSDVAAGVDGQDGQFLHKNLMQHSKIPLYLTLFRLVISPLFFPFLLVLFLPLNYIIFNVCLAVLFLLIGLTDFFDGYWARKWGHETHLGKV